MILSLIFSTIFTYAGITLNLDLEHKSDRLQKQVKTELGKFESIKIPNTNKIVKITASDDIPAGIPLKYQDESVKIKFQVYENDKLVSSPEVVTLYGKEALMSMSTKPGAMPSISLKVKATK